MKPRFLVAALAVACTAHSTNVWAQAFLSDPRLTEGLGVKAGDFEFHPGVAAEGGYDSNYFQASGDNVIGPPRVNEPVVPSFRLRLTPSVSFVSTGSREADEGGGPAPVLRLKGNLAATANFMFATGSQYSSDATKQNNVSGIAGLGAEILPGRAWGGDISADFHRILEASNEADVGNAWRRDIVRAGAGLVWRPGGGLFEWRLGYKLQGTFFEDSQYTDLNNLQHSVETSGSWKFLPRTALIYQGELKWLHFDETPQSESLNNGESLSSEIGINGLVSNYFGMLVLGGWGESFYGSKVGHPENYDNFIGQAEVTWYPTPQEKLPEHGAPVGLSSVSLGYRRSFAVSYLGQYLQQDRGYLSAAYFFADHFVLDLVGGLNHITRPPSYFPDGTPRVAGDETENRLDALAFFEYRPGPTVGINATFRYDAELTSRLIPLNVQNTAADQLEFDRYQVFLGVRWFL